ncbi:MAG: DUF3150 domain-containing protein [Rhodanobacter sp.]
MNNQPQVNLLDQVILVQLDIRRCDLESRIDRAVDLDATALPPASIVSAGVKRYVDPKRKAVFETIAKRAERACKRLGYQVLKGWAIPPEKAPELHKELSDLAKEYFKEADQLEKELPQLYLDWEKQNPGYEKLLERGRPRPDKVRSRYNFHHVMYRLKEAIDDADSPINDGLSLTRGSLIFGLLEDVAQNAVLLRDVHFKKGKSPTRTLVNSLIQITEKVASFSLMDPLLGAVAEDLSEVLATVGITRGSLTTTDAMLLRSVVDLLAEPTDVRARGQEILERGMAAPVAQLVEEPEDAANLPLPLTQVPEVRQPTRAVSQAVMF